MPASEQKPSLEDSTDKREKKKEKEVLRAMRKERNNDLRSKSVGLVGKINIGEASNSKRIVFGDAMEDSLDKGAEIGETSHRDGKTDYDSNDEDDDQIEEVKGMRAKELALEQRERERKTAGELQKLDSNRRKRKKAAEESDEEIEMDENFFNQLDRDLNVERQESKKIKNIRKGKHTAFISQEEKGGSINADHNIEVVTQDPTRCPLSNQVADLLKKLLYFHDVDCSMGNSVCRKAEN
eukprot:CAMPEP_0194259908 /NCGR_PEP_ID=MMETSP0158-20130606/44707_1 /TAXON_ID=33649 /ORGANISM="Thalassionema nitzschioides, Strain L26-B" /LENGTH=238 /DNA_ID=CAMNT_0038999891 /DNA_START=1 /DNA_END=718 /DNA_ORIENTATION=+